MYDARRQAVKADPAAVAFFPACSEPPEVAPAAARAWSAFQALTNDRAFENGVVRGIPFTAIDIYARRFGVDGMAFETMHRLVTALDAVYLSHIRKKQKHGAPPQK